MSAKEKPETESPVDVGHPPELSDRYDDPTLNAQDSAVANLTVVRVKDHETANYRFGVDLPGAALWSSGYRRPVARARWKALVDQNIERVIERDGDTLLFSGLDTTGF